MRPQGKEAEVGADRGSKAGPKDRLEAQPVVLTREQEDPQAQKNQGSQETHVEGDTQLSTYTIALGLVLHIHGYHGLS